MKQSVKGSEYFAYPLELTVVWKTKPTRNNEMKTFQHRQRNIKYG